MPRSSGALCLYLSDSLAIKGRESSSDIPASANIIFVVRPAAPAECALRVRVADWVRVPDARLFAHRLTADCGRLASKFREF
ncbi:hypothetical protein IRJ41_008488 [Triplophysa rosa]|uniref:Uncharacterized protein n=1 Tax=Triplophysa rosa TaxID=992332 RepID=A0A9W8CC71_TRIRA|nr:hypothetical protein IRJ41_008488 [Triplophysa rosa]